MQRFRVEFSQKGGWSKAFTIESQSQTRAYEWANAQLNFWKRDATKVKVAVTLVEETAAVAA